MNDIGISYEALMNYTEQFASYKKAAEMGLPIAQLNLATMYAFGKGIITDNAQAYAWVSIAIAKGLQNKNDEKRAISFKDTQETFLLRQDRTGALLKKAKELSKQYYEKYV